MLCCGSATIINYTRPLFPIPTRASPLRERQETISFNNHSRYSIKLVSSISKLKHKFQLENRVACAATRRDSASASRKEASNWERNDNIRRVVQSILWAAEGAYIIWLFLLPYAPGDPVWAISSETVNSLIGLQFLLHPARDKCCLSLMIPVMRYGRVAGIHVLEAPVLHPMSEGLFNFVIGWTFMFAPLLFTDKRRDRYKGSFDVLWGFQMFLTNTFLIPYMALRLNEADAKYTPRKKSQLSSVMTNGAPVGFIGGAICLISALWALFGRSDGNFGNLIDRWEFLVSYLRSERLAYAFIWDICLYVIFQPWLIGENIQNVQEGKVGLVNYLRFVPVFGLVAYFFV